MSAYPAVPRAIPTTVGVMWGVGDRMTAADDAMLSIIGFTRADLEAGLIDWRACTPPEYVHLDEAGIKQAAEGGGFTIPYRKEFIRKDGRRVPVLLVCAFTDLAAGAWMGYVVDLASETATRELPALPAASDPSLPTPEDFYRRLVGELVAERTRLTAMLDSSVAPMWAVDSQFRMLAANRAFQEAQRRISGRYLEVGESLMGPEFSEGDRTKWSRWYDRAFHGEHVRERTRLEAGGRVYQHDHSLSPLLDPMGRVHGVSVVSHDVSERAAMEDALRASEARFRTLALSSPLGVFLTDAGGRSVFVNGRMAEIWEVTREGEDELEVLAHVHPEDADRATQCWRTAIAAGSALEMEYRLLLPSGLERFVRLWLAPVRSEGVLTGFVGSIEDATERRAMADRAQRRVRMESLGTLAGGVAHDFNNMLAVVLGCAELALGEAGIPAAAREEMEEVVTASHRARDLVRQILTFSRQAEHPLTVLDLSALVRESGRLLRAILPARVTFTVRTPPEAVPVTGDAAALQQVIVNLCVNAEHALRDTGAPEISLGLRGDVEGGVPVARLTVRDNGSGMSRDVADRIFEPFFTTKPVGEGTGMGLAVVHGTILEHGGVITVQSTLGEGTTFEITLPISTAREDETEEPAEPHAGTGTILLVEDERALARVLEKTLARAGYTVITCHDGLEALRSIDTLAAAPDLVLTDVSMPRVGGDQLARALESRWPDVPVILMSGFHPEVQPDGPVGPNVLQVLQKPMTQRALLEAVERVLG